MLGDVHLNRGDLETGRERLEEALALARESGSPLLAGAITGMSDLQYAERQLDAAAANYEEALPLYRTLGTPDLIAFCLLRMTDISIERGRAESAHTTLREAVDITIKLDCRWTARAVLDSSAAMCVLTGQFERAAQFYGAATAHGDRMGSKRDSMSDAFLAPFMAKSQDILGTIAFADAMSAGNALGYEHAMADAAACLALDVASLKVPQ